ncbi:hypothetical protein SMA75_20200 [Escherichia coli]|uniref:hypothetical protein n=1 Tax=Escherichia coli TaxID=562 RepID=UPI00307B06FC
MKVILKTTVIDRILKALSDARRDRREPDYIVVTHEEYDELRHDARSYHFFHDAWQVRYVPPTEKIDTTDIIRYRHFERIEHYRYPDSRRMITAMPSGKFTGVDLYVIPKEYHPQ